MAGIGFQLQNILAKGSWRHVLAAYLFSAVVAAGAWLTAIGARAQILLALLILT